MAERSRVWGDEVMQRKSGVNRCREGGRQSRAAMVVHGRARCEFGSAFRAPDCCRYEGCRLWQGQ